MDRQFLNNTFSRYLENISNRFELRMSKKCKDILTETSVKIIEEITEESGAFCEINSKSTLTQENFLFVLHKMNLNRYKIEILEENKRSQKDTIEIGKIYSQF
jgi:histone H3/H4